MFLDGGRELEKNTLIEATWRWEEYSKMFKCKTQNQKSNKK